MISVAQILFLFGQFWKAEYYSYSYSFIFRRPNIIRICIWLFSEGRILFIFVFGHFWKTEYYSYSYSVIFGRPNNIHIRIRSSKHFSLTSGSIADLVLAFMVHLVLVHQVHLVHLVHLVYLVHLVHLLHLVLVVLVVLMYMWYSCTCGSPVLVVLLYS